MKKIFILDTNIFLTDPNALYNFSNNDIIIPFKVLEELDKKKNLQDVLGSNARHLIRKLDQLREKGNLSKGVKIEKGKGFVSVKEAKNNTLNNTPDNSIISVAIQAKNDNISKKVIVVSRDINMRVKCDSLNILAEGYDINKIIDKKEHIYTGQTNHLVDDQIIDRFYNDESIYLEKEEVKLYPNQFLMLISNQNDKKTALAKFINYSFPLKNVNEYKKGIYGVIPKNKEQQFALNLLMDSKIPVVTLNGLAGSGKTLLCLAAGLEQTIEKNIYKRLVVIRPVMPLGRDIGFLPGSIQEKLEPYIMPIIDNLRFLFNNDRMMLDEYIKKDIIEIEAMTYIRGRSISDSFLLLDEAQNLTSHELKTVLTRIGENSKIVITGDLGQIDSPYLNETTSGLTNVIEKFKTQELSGHITLTKGERSLVATISSKIL